MSAALVAVVAWVIIMFLLAALSHTIRAHRATRAELDRERAVMAVVERMRDAARAVDVRERPSGAESEE